MFTYFRDTKHDSKNKNKICKTLTSLLEPIHTIVIIGATTTSVTLSVAVVGLTVVPISVGIVCSLVLGNKLLNKIIKNKHNRYEKHWKKIKIMSRFLKKDKKKFSRVILIDEVEFEILFSIFTISLDETKEESFFEKKI